MIYVLVLLFNDNFKINAVNINDIHSGHQTAEAMRSSGNVVNGNRILFAIDVDLAIAACHSNF